MDSSTARTNLSTEGGDQEALIRGILEGYRFTVCQSAADFEAALDVRRRVYVQGSGYDVPVPDEYDRRSWLLLARDVASGAPVGSVRVTPRSRGPVEAEEYFRLPPHLRSPRTAEISRLAILPAHRKSRTFIPTVSLGLFKTVVRVLERTGVEYPMLCAKPERVWTFEWMRYQRTGLSAAYRKLAGARHELLWFDFKHRERIYDGHPFRTFFLVYDYDEVVLPTFMPQPGMRPAASTLRRLTG